MARGVHGGVHAPATLPRDAACALPTLRRARALSCARCEGPLLRSGVSLAVCVQLARLVGGRVGGGRGGGGGGETREIQQNVTSAYVITVANMETEAGSHRLTSYTSCSGDRRKELNWVRFWATIDFMMLTSSSGIISGLKSSLANEFVNRVSWYPS